MDDWVYCSTACKREHDDTMVLEEIEPKESGDVRTETRMELMKAIEVCLEPDKPIVVCAAHASKSCMRCLSPAAYTQVRIDMANAKYDREAEECKRVQSKQKNTNVLREKNGLTITEKSGTAGKKCYEAQISRTSKQTGRLHTFKVALPSHLASRIESSSATTQTSLTSVMV